MADTPGPQPKELYSIVVVGKMNPAIHHPVWYQYLGLLDQRERDAAVGGPLVVMQQVSQFKAPAFTILCTPDRWEIQAFYREFMDRILVIASKVFDVLTHTPVSSYGFNFHVHKEVNVENPGRSLGNVVRRLPFGLNLSDNMEGELSAVAVSPYHRLTISVANSPLGQSLAWIRFNAHYDVAVRAEPTHFDLASLLTEHFWPDFERAQRYNQSVADGFSRIGDGNGGSDS